MSPLVIPISILEEARVFFEDCGTKGCEGTAMIIGGLDGVARRLVIPDQRATPLPYCSVEVTRQGKFDLLSALGPNDAYVSRIHSHPGLAFHSSTDGLLLLAGYQRLVAVDLDGLLWKSDSLALDELSVTTFANGRAGCSAYDMAGMVSFEVDLPTGQRVPDRDPMR